MPTYETDDRFWHDWDRLSGAQQKLLKVAVLRLVADLREMEAGRRSSVRPGLKVKGVKGARGVFEMWWASDGRATFSWGEERLPGRRHIIWHRCGGDHEILKQP